MRSLNIFLIAAISTLSVSCNQRTYSGSAVEAVSDNPASIIDKDLSTELIREVEASYQGDKKALWKDNVLDIPEIGTAKKMMNSLGDIRDLTGFVVRLNGDYVDTIFPDRSMKKAIQTSAIFKIANAFRKGMSSPRAKSEDSWFIGFHLWISCTRTTAATPEFSCKVYKAKYFDGGAI
jgi:hypothetical protein